MLAGKRILLGISGGIAAYKGPLLVRELVAAGAEVRVVLTEAATHFVAPMALQAVSGHAVAFDLFDPVHEDQIGHIELARWPDAI
jgi:phosphopantothenoylcysteine decarboxylase/phosphopantothenate--cysteine ligase